MVTNEAEIKTPSWFKKGIKYFFVTEESVIQVIDSIISRWDNTHFGAHAFQEKALEASTGEEITREEFEQKYSDVVASFDSVVNALPEEKEEKPILITEAQKWADIR